MQLFHGSYEEDAPRVKIGVYALGAADNVFDGIFASDRSSVAESHGEHVYAYEVQSIACSRDLHCDDAIKIIADELCITDLSLASEIAEAVADEASLADYAEYLDPRSAFDADDLGWEMQRLRGVIARNLGYDAVECLDEHGTSYLIVNPEISAFKK
ncbi:MAG: hypothetical protein Q4A69_08410 [Moraxella sp.]|nr:hypothetical protein [Moraxella sp.]